MCVWVSVDMLLCGYVQVVLIFKFHCILLCCHINVTLVM